MPEGRVTIPVVAIEFEEGGSTLWVHGLAGTVLRIQTTGKFTTSQCTVSPVSHADLNITGDVEICIGRDVEFELDPSIPMEEQIEKWADSVYRMGNQLEGMADTLEKAKET